jgi:two-component system KDP operon response regulator KdpE
VTTKATILIVEDNELLQRILRRALEHEGYAVLEAASGEQLFECLEREKPDLIVLDLGLPDVDGRQVLARLKHDPRTADIRVVMWSGEATESTRRGALDLGATAFVEKGPADSLVAKIERILLKLSERPPPRA